MVKKKNRRSSSKRSKWPLIGAAAAVILGIIWNDRRQEARQIQSCGLIMAESGLPNAGWGVFTLKPHGINAPVAVDEVTIQMPDVRKDVKDNLIVLIERFTWAAHAAGGIFEGWSVLSAIPGIGSLANGHPGLANVISTKPDIDHQGLRRDTHPGAGAMTHYRNLQWRTRFPLSPGDEIIVDYKDNWREDVSYSKQPLPQAPRKSPTNLQQNGMCLDNILPGKSTIENAGKGAFSSRYIAKEGVIAPAPLIPIRHRNALKMTQFRTNEDTGEREYIFGNQLLLNYCFGHPKSSLLFFPYSPMVNLINHDSKRANAKLKWSESSLHVGKDWLEYPLDKFNSINRTGLLMEIIATRDLGIGEEILLDYGQDWEQAWNKHVQEWQPMDVERYVYPTDFDKQDELPLEIPENLMTACFYNAAERGVEVMNGAGTIVWKRTRTSMKETSIRPCTLLQKDVDPTTGQVTYTATMGNATISKDKIVPNMEHTVTGIPRDAIMIKDKTYYSDLHLPNAFRQEIAIPTEIFPQQWMDLSSE